MNRISHYSSGRRRTLNFEEFRDDFLAFCEAHRAQGRALAFAFILYDHVHPHVRQVLATTEYWDSLDELSGRTLSTFSFDLRPPHSESGRRSMTRIQTPHLDQGTAALTDHLGNSVAAELPCVLFFQVHGGEVLDSFVVPFGGTDASSTFEELTGVIGMAVDSLARVADDNAPNSAEILHLVKRAARERRTRNRAWRVLRLAQPAGSAAGLVELLRHLLG